MDQAEPIRFCISCRYTDGRLKEKPKGVLLRGGWVLFHCDGTFLGRLVLQTNRHVEGFKELSDKGDKDDKDAGEAQCLGQLLKAIEDVMRKNWKDWFAEDLVHLYVVSFQEAHGYHLHIHLIPRPKSFESLHNWGDYEAWGIAKIHNDVKFPALYKYDPTAADALLTAIEDNLRKEYPGLCNS